MGTTLSVNVNKIALLRNSRGRDYPNLVSFVERLISLGVEGVTVHPRSDERHITRQDTLDIAKLLKKHEGVELNVEGYPSDDFLRLVEQVQPDQCSLVPDGPDQLTSDHGWNLLDPNEKELVSSSCERLQASGIRTALFLESVIEQVSEVPDVGADRIELYTETYAASFGSQQQDNIFERFKLAAHRANELGVGVNAGHDLDLKNLAKFLTIPNILEVSIGHALVVECIEYGVESVINRYLAICRSITSHSWASCSHLRES